MLVCCLTFSASSQVSTVPDGGVFSPIFFMACLNSSRSSALLMDGSFAPMSSTPYFSSRPPCRQATCNQPCKQKTCPTAQQQHKAARYPLHEQKEK